ncbi:hypothetical protein MTR67_025626 [Solanum verrucosum]|uniref:Uncharacterized protein n=1 Tax=Solanum verrucosum TaxID=315347 RepID=A0AAF0TTQ2_SOLVR|nr:hypothetical protein MTR67_025626 [Solanum verrucosum]
MPFTNRVHGNVEQWRSMSSPYRAWSLLIRAMVWMDGSFDDKSGSGTISAVSHSVVCIVLNGLPGFFYTPKEGE